MSFRFKKSIKILPGIKLNISKNGINSVTIGKPGASVNLSEKGKQATVAIPGTGLSYSKKFSSSINTSSTSSPPPSSPEPSPKQAIRSTKIIMLSLLVIFSFLIGAVFF